jgi:opacity protein-like surface antigen
MNLRSVYVLVVTLLEISASTCLASASDLQSNSNKKTLPVSINLNWGGFYIGTNITSTSSSDSQKEYYLDTWDGFGAELSLQSIGGGISMGYDFQVSDNFVVGLIASGTWLNQKKASFQYNGYTPGALNTNYPVRDTLQYMADIRARFGYVFGKFFPYLTAGVAFVAIERGYQGIDWYNFSEIQPGYVVGAGTEYRINQNISVNFEYAKSVYKESRSITSLIPTYASPSYQLNNLSIDDFKIGVNYRF